MSDRLDLLKSLVKSAADRAQNRTLNIGPVAALRRFVKEAARRRTVIHDRALSSAVARIPGVTAASVATRGGAVRVDASFDDGGHVALGLVPAGSTFAPRGAKELRLRVVPPEAASQRHASDVAGAIAGEVARVIWAMLLRDESDLAGAIVDRDGDLYRIDLRTIPAVRAQASHGTMAMLIEALEPGHIEARDGALEVQIKLPSFGR
ncbi:MAG: hypothetical protein JRH11_08615 [Deltaproteobacteria bacterium]|nr:hypothetical protein [Deltaproteobacteria bacterium]